MSNTYRESSEDIKTLLKHDSRRSLRSLFLTVPLYLVGVVFVPALFIALFLNIKAIFSAISYWKLGFFNSRAGVVLNVLLLLSVVAFYIFIPLAIIKETGQFSL